MKTGVFQSGFFFKVFTAAFCLSLISGFAFSQDLSLRSLKHRLFPNFFVESLQLGATNPELVTRLNQEAEKNRKEVSGADIELAIEFWSESFREQFFTEYKLPTTEDLQALLESEAPLPVRLQAIIVHTSALRSLYPEDFDMQISSVELAKSQSLRERLYISVGVSPSESLQLAQIDRNYYFDSLQQTIDLARMSVEFKPQETLNFLFRNESKFHGFENEVAWFADYLRRTKTFVEKDFLMALSKRRQAFLTSFCYQLDQQPALWADSDAQMITDYFSVSDGKVLGALTDEQKKKIHENSEAAVQAAFEEMFSHYQQMLGFNYTYTLYDGKPNYVASGVLLAAWLGSARLTRWASPKEIVRFPQNLWARQLQSKKPAGISDKRLNELLNEKSSSKFKQELSKYSNHPEFQETLSRARQQNLSEQRVRGRLEKKRGESTAKAFDRWLQDQVFLPNAQFAEDSKEACQLGLAQLSQKGAKIDLPDSAQGISSKEASQFLKANGPITKWQRLNPLRWRTQAKLKADLERLSFDPVSFSLLHRGARFVTFSLRSAFALSVLGNLLWTYVQWSEPAPELNWKSLSDGEEDDGSQEIDLDHPLLKPILRKLDPLGELQEVATQNLFDDLQTQVVELNQQRKQKGLKELELVADARSVKSSSHSFGSGSQEVLVNGLFPTAYVLLREKTPHAQRFEDLEATRRRSENAFVLQYQMQWENDSAENVLGAGTVGWTLKGLANLSKANRSQKNQIIRAFVNGYPDPDYMPNLFSGSEILFEGPLAPEDW